MNPKHTWIWLSAAAGLFALIFFLARHPKVTDGTPDKILPGFDPAAVNSVQVVPKGERAIVAVRTNSVWRLVEPVNYPADPARIDLLLAALAHLPVAVFISGQELKDMPDADAQYGFETPQFSLTIGQKHDQILFGNRNGPGGQVFAKVGGTEGVYVVDAAMLEFLPHSVDDWRDRAMVDWNQVKFDRLAVTNAGKVLMLHLDASNATWHMTQPMDARADNAKILASLKQLTGLRAVKFLPDAQSADLDSLGLQNPDSSIGFYAGTNSVLLLEFGNSPTNDTSLVYARRADLATVMTVPKQPFDSWQVSHSDNFRDFVDHHLLVLAHQPDVVEVHGQDDFRLQQETNGAWRIEPQDWPADAGFVKSLLGYLGDVKFDDIVRDSVPDQELAQYGLSQPKIRYQFEVAGKTATGEATNVVVSQLNFGTTGDKVFARVAGEGFVYAINPTNFEILPDLSWKFRERRIWHFTEEDVARIIIHQGEKTRELIRTGKGNWALAPGSSGIIDEIFKAAVEESAHRLGELSATAWVQEGDQDLDKYGFKETNYQITIELKSGEKVSVEFGRESPAQYHYANVELDGKPWIFEFPSTLYELVQIYLSIPANVP